MTSIRRIAFLSLSLLAFARQSQAQGRALSIEDYYRVKTVGAPQMSPESRWVAYTVSTRIEATNGDSSEVWLAPTDGSQPARRVSPAGTQPTTPQWSDDGRLAFRVGGRAVSVDPAMPDSISENPNVIPQGGRFALGGRVASPDGKLVAVARHMTVTR